MGNYSRRPYVAGNGDLIFDHDGEGRVTFNGQPVGGGIFDSASGKYLSLDGGLFYSLSGDTLSVEQAGSGDTLTIKRFSSGALGIDLAAAPAAVVTETQKTGTAASELWDVTHGGPSTDPSYDGLPGVEYVLKDFDSLNTFNLADHLIGGDGDDWIEAWEAPWYDGEYLGHAPDTDIVEGGRGQDFISGGPGDDRLYATDAVDAESVSQGLGSAEYNTGIAAADASWLYSEVDIVNGSLGEDEIYGSGGRDILHGGFGSDLIYAGNGNDYIDGDHDFALTWTWAGARGWDYQSDGRVVMTASDSRGIADPDDAELVIYLAPGANDTIFAGNGHDNVQGGFHDDVVYGGDGNDSIQGDSSKVDDLGIPIVPSQLHGRDYLAGEGGDDTIDGNGGDDIVYGGTGNDLLDGDSRYFASSTDAEYHGDDYVDGGTGDDTISGSGGADILLGGAGSDVLFGDLDGLDAMHHGDDVLYGDDGNDQLVGQGGDDVLNGGTGNDILYGDDLDVGAVQGNDQLFGGAGADELSGGLGADTLSGGEDDDGLWGDAGDDRLSGGKGGDYLEGGAGADTYVLSAGDGPENGAALDTIVDGAGQDNRLEFASNVDTGSIRLNPVADSADLIIHYADGDTVYVAGALAGSIDAYSFDGLSFTPYRDFLAAHIPNAQYLDGDAADNLVFGDGSGSPLSGAAGDDTLVGGAGDDILDGGAGANRLIGGAGADVYQINATPQIGWVSASLNIIVDNDDRSSVVRFGAGVRPIDFTGYQEFTYDTAIIISSPFNSLVIVDGKYGNVVNRFEFADGSAYTFSEFKALITEAPTVIEGDQQPQLLSGTPGRDSINGAAGADTLSGDDGGDSLDGGEGADSLVGGLGNDTYVVDDAGDIVVEAAHEGYDKVLASVDYALPDHVEALELTGPDATTGTGNALDNHLVGTGNTLLLTGGDGSDYIQGADTVDGGAGDDELHGFVVYGGDGNDRIYASAPNGYNLPQPQLWGGAGDDVYTLDNHYQTSLRAEIGESADEGTDTLILRSHVIIMPALPQHIENVRYEFTGSVWFGADGVRLGGNDLDNLIEVGRGNPDGNYVLEGFAGNDTLIGSEFDDSGSGTLGLYGGEGDDLLQGRQGDDLLDGGAGSDTLEGGSGNDVLNGMDGNDRLYGGDGSDVLEGGQGSDSLDGGRGADTLDGGAGNDYLIADDQHGGSVFRGGTGDDVLAGSRNADTYHYRSGDGRDIIDERYGHAGHTDLLILEDLDPTDVAVTRDGSSLLIDVVTDGGQIVLWKWYDNPSNRLESIEFENQTLWDMQTLHDLGLEVVFGATNDRLEGLNNQPDRMYGGGGEDSLYGYGEADQLNGDGGNDLIEGGAGDDVLTGGDGADTLEGGDGNDFLYGNTGADRISGGQGNDYVHGGKGNDSMYGNTGDDTMLGGADNDSLHGGKDNDLLFGKDGDDTLLGGAGDDTLHGDAGNDYLSGVAGNDSYRYYAGGGQDEIAEFDGNDQLLFMDIGHDQLWFERLGDNLVISVIGTPDQVAVNDWYLDASKHIEVFHSGDSMALENTGLEQLVNAMASFQKPSMGQTSLSSELRDDLSPYLAAAWQ